MGPKRGGLQKRITLVLTLIMSTILLSFGIVSYYIVQGSISSSIDKEVALVRVIRNEVEEILKNNINRLYDVSLSGSIDLRDNDFAPEKEALAAAYKYSIFTDGVFLLDKDGNVLLTYPEKLRDISVNLLSIEPISRAIAMERPVVSNLYTIEPLNKKVLFILVPLKDKNGNAIGVVGGEIDPTNPILSHVLMPSIGRATITDIVDSNGMIIASSIRARSLTPFCNDGSGMFAFKTVIGGKKEVVRKCHRCHNANVKQSNNIMAYAPLEIAPWGVSVQEPEKIVFAPATNLKKTFILLGIVFLGAAFLLSIGINRSIVRPINELTTVADRIARGDLSKPVPICGSDEINILSKSFEVMRQKLVALFEEVKTQNIELERRVAARTHEVIESRKKIEQLLQKVISSQEDEKKRIARELHDTILQDISACLIKMDTFRVLPQSAMADAMDDIKKIMEKVIDNTYEVIKDMRPAILDDLGIDAAVMWLLDRYLKGKGINYYLDVEFPIKGKLSPAVEIALFRVLQEAIVNISRHSNAKNVFVCVEREKSNVKICLEDDGDGFDVQELKKYPFEDGRGLGIIGMKERVALLGGDLKIHSRHGEGTIVCVEIPLKSGEKNG